MNVALPRRPRRWSPACTAVGAQVIGVFALVVTVAMPTRDLQVRAVDVASGIVIVAEAGGVRAVRLGSSRFDSGRWQRLEPWSSFACAALHPGGWRWACRETGPRVVLGGFRTWLKH